MADCIIALQQFSALALGGLKLVRVLRCHRQRQISFGF
jgi:hypothetical protein